MHMHLNYYPFSEVMIAVIFPSDLIRNATETVLHISHRFPLCAHSLDSLLSALKHFMCVNMSFGFSLRIATNITERARERERQTTDTYA